MKVKILKDNRARKALIDFGNLELGKTMEIFVDKGDGENFVQRMRVRMSRVRDKIKQAKKVPAQFTMKLEKIEAVMHNGVEMDKVILKKTKNGLTDFEDLLADIEPFEGLISNPPKKAKVI